MKKALMIISVMLLFAMPMSIFVYASDPAEDAQNKFLDEIPDDIAEKLPDDVAAFGGEYLSELLSKSLSDAFSGSGKSLLAVISAVIIASVFRAVGNSGGDDICKISSIASGISVTTAVFSVIVPVRMLLISTLQGISIIMKILLPAMTVIYASSGNFTSSAVSSTWVTLILTLIDGICNTVLSPLFSVCFGFLVISCLSSFSSIPCLADVSALLKKCFSILLLILGAVLSAVMAHQSVLASKSDSVLLRSVKFTAGNTIPIIGGTISEISGSYLAGISLIRSTCGTFAALSVVIYLLPSFLQILICKFGFGIAAALGGLLGCENEKKIISEGGGILDLALSLLAVCGSVFLIAIGIFAGTVAGG